MGGTGGQCIDIGGIDNIRVVTGPIVYNSGVGGAGRVVNSRGVRCDSGDALNFTTTGGIGGSGRGKHGEEGEEQEDGEGRSGNGARHCH